MNPVIIIINQQSAMKRISITSSISDLFKAGEEFYNTHAAQQSVDKLTEYMISKGTSKDKLNALYKQITSDPQYSLKYIQVLLNHCKDMRNKKQGIMGCQIMRDLFTEHILVGKNKLNYFSESVYDKIKESKKNKKLEMVTADLLSQFYLEHKIKYIYNDFLKVLEELLKDNLNYLKKESLNILVDLSKFNELQNTIFELLVNKFGDSDLQLVNELTKSLKLAVAQNFQILGPLLKGIELFLFRKNIAKHAQFYCINFLSNLTVKYLHQKHLTELLQLYFKLFKKLVITDSTNEEQDISSKLFLNVVKGLNRIFPVVKGQFKQFNQIFEDKVQTIYKIVHTTTNTKVKIQLYLFLYQSQNHIYKSLPDRYYRSLYEFLTDEKILTSSLLELFFDLLLISIKQDTNAPRVQAFVKRLIQLAFTASPGFIITTLIFVSKLMQTHNSILTMLHNRQNFWKDEEDPNANQSYDMFKREPIHAKAENSCLWEITPFMYHYHPTVRKFADILINKKNNVIEFQGNPLLDFSLTNFLEKLCLKSEKKSDGWKLKNKKNLTKIRPSKYDTLINKPVSEFTEEEAFLVSYIQKKKQLNQTKKKTSKELEDYADEVVEKEMDKVLGKDIDEDDQIQYSDIQQQEDQQLDQLQEEQLQEQLQDEDNEDDPGPDILPQDQQDQFADQYANQFADQQADQFNDEQLEDQDDDDEDMDQQEQSEEKDFNDVFQKIGIDKISKRKQDKKKLNSKGRTKPIKKGIKRDKHYKKSKVQRQNKKAGKRKK